MNEVRAFYENSQLVVNYLDLVFDSYAGKYVIEHYDEEAGMFKGACYLSATSMAPIKKAIDCVGYVVVDDYVKGKHEVLAKKEAEDGESEEEVDG